MTKNNLHTDALEKKYGPIKVIVLRHDPLDYEGERIRETKLVDKHGILRTYALTLLNGNNKSEELLEIDNKIKEGALIGRTFKQYGYDIERTVLGDFVFSLPLWMQKDFGVSQRTANARLIEFRVRKGTQALLLYGTLIEIYSPDFETPRELDHTDNDHLLQKEPIGSLYNKIIKHLEVGAV